MQFLWYVEPYTSNGLPSYIIVSKKAAIAKMKEGHPELSSREALDEFIAVNWASYGPPFPFLEKNK